MPCSGRSRSRDRKPPSPENPPSILITGYTPFRAELPPLGLLYREIPYPKIPRGVIRRDDKGLSKSNSMTAPRLDSRPFLRAKLTKSASSAAKSKRPSSCHGKWERAEAKLPPPVPGVAPAATCALKPPAKEERRPRSPNRELGETDESDFTCAICLEILYRPRELSCGHAFCLTCLQSYSNTCSSEFSCPSCRQRVDLPSNGVCDLPRNSSLEKVAEALGERRNSMARRAKICFKCHNELEIKECAHCGKGWCPLCHQGHMREVKEQLLLLKERLDQSKESLVCKREEEETRFNKLQERIKEAIEIRKAELINKVQTLRQMSQERVSRISQELDKTLSDLSIEQNDQTSLDKTWKQYNDINLLLESVSSSVEARLTFDPTSLTLGSLEEGNSGREHNVIQRPSNAGEEDLEDDEDERFIIPKDLTEIYRKKSSYAKYRWGQNICSRPAGIAVSPWTGYLYVTASDSCKVHIFDQVGKQINSFGSRGHRDGSFLCPIGIAFSLPNKELYITDKWKHCIHVFDAEGRFLRQIGRKGKGFGEFSSPEGIATDMAGKLYVADTCNDRVQILDSDGVFLGEVGLVSSEFLCLGRRLYTQREFNEPVGVAVSSDGSKVYIADSGNHRIRVFDGQSGQRLLMFGSRGYNKGQLESPESIAVDDEGFILVGDSGNGRIQIFRPNGRLVRSLGGKSNKKGEFGWVSGLALTKNKEVIVTDFKNNTICAF